MKDLKEILLESVNYFDEITDMFYKCKIKDENKI
jgi:hypothetical protein